MPCDNCTRLQAQLDALLTPPEAFVLSKRLRVAPRVARMLLEMLKTPGVPVPSPDLIAAMRYSGDRNHKRARSSLSQNIRTMREGLSDAGMKTSDIVNGYTQGYAITVAAAERIRRMVS